MRQLLRHTYLSVLGTFAKPSNGVHILNSHFIAPNSDDPNIFYDQLSKLNKNVTFINIMEAVNLIKKKEKIDQPLVAFTYDDGFKECYSSILPVLDSYGISAAFFVNPNFIESDSGYKEDFLKRINSNKEPMNWNEVKTIHKKGHIIGAHTMDHINLGNKELSTEELEHQLITCRSIIEKKIGNNCNMFAFPFGLKEHLTQYALNIATEHFDYIFSGTDYKNYFSFDDKVINRRHCEPYWPISHLNYFLSVNKKF